MKIPITQLTMHDRQGSPRFRVSIFGASVADTLQSPVPEILAARYPGYTAGGAAQQSQDALQPRAADRKKKC